jgi:hypothetical protein
MTGPLYGCQRSKRARMSGLSGVAVVVRLGAERQSLATSRLTALGQPGDGSAKALREPAIDERQQVSGLGALALVAPRCAVELVVAAHLSEIIHAAGAGREYVPVDKAVENNQAHLTDWWTGRSRFEVEGRAEVVTALWGFQAVERQFGGPRK